MEIKLTIMSLLISFLKHQNELAHSPREVLNLGGEKCKEMQLKFILLIFCKCEKEIIPT